MKLYFGLHILILGCTWVGDLWGTVQVYGAELAMLYVALVLSAVSNFEPETKPPLQCRWSHSYARWAVKPRYWTLAMKFFKDKIINLDLLAEFQSLYLTSYLSSSGSFSYHDLHPLSSRQLPCGISLLTSAEVAGYPAQVLIQQGSTHFAKTHCC